MKCVLQKRKNQTKIEAGWKENDRKCKKSEIKEINKESEKEATKATKRRQKQSGK